MEKINQKRGAKELSYDERKSIEACIKLNLPLSQIAKLLNRPANTIKNEVCRNGSRLFYSADKAQERATRMKIQRTISTVQRFSPQVDPVTQGVTLEQRIDSLEMQLEIILETLEKLREING